MAKFRAPAQDGQRIALPTFEAIPELIRTNRQLFSSAQFHGGSLDEYRRVARQEIRELLAVDSHRPHDAPFFITGHQPELFHPGVWIKNFAIDRLAREWGEFPLSASGGIPINLIVDHDTMKSTSLSLPTWDQFTPRNVIVESIAFDRLEGEIPFEQRTVIDRGCFDTFSERVADATRHWNYEPLLKRVWPIIRNQPASATIAERFTAARVMVERDWGLRNYELPLSRLCQTRAFAKFFKAILNDADRFRRCYNSSVLSYRRRHRLRSRTHPVPELAANELPFWQMTDTGRRPLTRQDRIEAGRIRPRALSLTLFVRMALADMFVHGIGGGQYDEVTDDIIRGWLQTEPPAFQILTATKHLPLPRFPHTLADVRRLDRQIRDYDWNPQRYLDEINPLVQAKNDLVSASPATRRERRDRFRQLRRLTEATRLQITHDKLLTEELRQTAYSEAQANARLQRRDYSWVLYPEHLLRDFMTDRQAI